MQAPPLLVALVWTLAFVQVVAPASAHFTLLSPPPASKSAGGGKGAPPCGPPSDTGVVTEVQGGHPLQIVLNETRFHPGFYRVALSLEDRAELPPDNVVYDANGTILPPNGQPAGESARADFEVAPRFPVLADNLFAHSTNTNLMFTGEISLPNVSCERCTLQVIEFMAKHGWNDPGGYFYHHCADLKIIPDPRLPLFDPDAPDGAGGGAAGARGSDLAAGASNGGEGGAIPTTGGVAPTGGVARAGGAAPDDTAGAAFGGQSTETQDGGTGALSTPNGSEPGEDSGCSCGAVKRRNGSPSALATLGLLFALGRRRRVV